MAHLVRPSRILIKPLSISIPASRSVVTYQQTLLNIPPTKVTTVPNGIRVATENTGGHMATIGVWMNAGSRYEHETNRGVGHFLERMAFKGTTKRSQTELEVEIENIGAQFNVCSSREQTCFYTDCLSEDIPKVVEILSDVIQNNKLDEAEVERERKAVLQELEDVQNDLKMVTMDYLHSVAFQGTSLSQSVLGPTETIKALTHKDLADYTHRFFRPGQMVLAGAGGVDHQLLADLAQEHFREPEPLALDPPKFTPSRYIGSDVRDRDDAKSMCHVAIALQGPSWSDPDLIPFMVGNAFVGSWDRMERNASHSTSRLVQDVFKYQSGHSFESFNICYSDTGLWGIYFVGDRMKLDDFVYCIQRDWMKLCSNMTDHQVEGAKNRLRNNLLRQLERTTGTCKDIGRQMLCYGYRTPLHEIEARIDAVNAELIQEVFYERIYDKCPVVAAVGPCESLSDYNRIRNNMVLPVF